MDRTDTAADDNDDFRPRTYAGLDIRKLGHDGVADVHGLMMDVVSRLRDQAWFAADDDAAYFHALLDDRGELFGAYLDGRLGAYSVLAYLGSDRYETGRKFGVREDELSRVWVLDATVVHESVRGRGLQRYFNALREERALAKGALHLCATVHPDNAASLRNLEAAGFERRFTRPMYGGLLRHGYGKSLHPSSDSNGRHSCPSEGNRLVQDD